MLINKYIEIGTYILYRTVEHVSSVSELNQTLF